MKSLTLRICSFVLIVMILAVTSLTGVSAETFIIDDGFKFTRESNNTITIHGYEGTEPIVSVPSYLLSQKVQAINEYAFMYNEVIKTVSMPNSISTVGRGAFYGCPNLESVQLPKNCTQIGQYMFYECSSLQSVTMPTMLKEVPRYCFSFCSSLETVTLPSTAKVIGEYAFSDCPNLKSVYVSRYTNSISLTAFEDSPQAVIFGYMNTYAHQFAIENSIPFSAVDATDQTLYVTFYDYDGSIYMKVPVTKGSSIKFPASGPEKPDTDTHYYEFSYWEGNVNNIQQNEFIYPVYEEYEKVVENPEVPEPEIPEQVKTYTVVFLNSDDVFMSIQTVEEGQNAYAPDDIPSKESTLSHYYIFTGWDKDFTNVTENLIIRPNFEELALEYKVTFLGANGELLDEQIVHYGDSITPPEAPEIEGYTFVGWDHDLEFIPSNLTVTALYEVEKAPVVPASTGKFRAEVTGGTGFTIAVNGGNARPQGTSYMNTKMPIGAAVTLVASNNEGYEFLGWVNDAGVALSLEETYTFLTTGNDYVKAMYKTPVDGVNSVIFKNDRAAGGKGHIIDMQYYSTEDEISYPANPSLAGYDFMGWNMTAEDIQQKLTAGEDAVVLATWKLSEVYVDVIVEGGEITYTLGQNSEGQYRAYNKTIATANTAEAGMKFAYWTDENGNILSYKTDYEFYPAADMSIKAVYVTEDTVVEITPVVTLSADPTTEGEKITYYLLWDVDQTAVGKVTALGIIIVDKADYNEATFVHGTTDSKVFDRAFANKVAQSGVYAPVKTGSVYDHTYVAAMWLTYTDAVTGEAITVYSPVVETYKPIV